jgi:hypothetical protein
VTDARPSRIYSRKPCFNRRRDAGLLGPNRALLAQRDSRTETPSGAVHLRAEGLRATARLRAGSTSQRTPPKPASAPDIIVRGVRMRCAGASATERATPEAG